MYNMKFYMVDFCLLNRDSFLLRQVCVHVSCCAAQSLTALKILREDQLGVLKRGEPYLAGGTHSQQWYRHSRPRAVIIFSSSVKKGKPAKAVGLVL